MLKRVRFSPKTSVYGGSGAGGPAESGSGTYGRHLPQQDIIYYDMTVKNNSTTDSIPDTFLNTSSNQNILGRAGDYDVAIIRFSIPSDSVPILKQFYCNGLTGTFTSGSNVITNVSSNPGFNSISNLAVGMVFQLTSSQALLENFPTLLTISNVVYSSPTVATITTNVPYTGSTQTTTFKTSLFYFNINDTDFSEQYSIFAPSATFSTYEGVISFLNDAIITSLMNISSTDGRGYTVNAPFFYLDEATGLISFYSQDNGIILSVSPQLYELVRGIPTFATPSINILFAFDTSVAGGLNYVTVTPSPVQRIAVENGTTTITVNALAFPIIIGSVVSGPGITPGTTVTAVTGTEPGILTLTLSATATMTGSFRLSFTNPPYQAFRMTQAASSLYNWSPLKRILLTTGQIPVKQTVTQPALSLATGVGVTASQSVTRPVLTDFEPLAQKQDYTPYQYYPQGPWRLIPLQGDDELRAVDMQVYWEDFNGNYNLFQIPPTKESSKLLAFVRKG